VQNQSDSGLFPKNRMVFSRCDICEKAFQALETEIFDSTSAIPEEVLEQREPIIVICNSCRQELELFPYRR
jgi:uncharacterized protein with PIN domain